MTNSNSPETKTKSDNNTQVTSVAVAQIVTTTTRKIAESWDNFKPEIPLSYLLASRKAARLKNS